MEESVQLFAPLLSLPIPEDRYPPLNFSPQRQRQKTLESHRRDPVGTCRTSTCPLYPGRPTLDGPHNPGVARSPAGPDTHGIHLGAAHVSSAFSTCLASPFVYHRNNVKPLITHSRGPDRHTHDRWENLTTRGACSRSSRRRMVSHCLWRK